ncbi:hypothetical protein CPB86DRAFT_790832, partial [Serendipita vermifera]
MPSVDHRDLFISPRCSQQSIGTPSMSSLRRIFKRKGKRKVVPNDEEPGMNLGDLNPTNVPSIYF